MTGSSPLARGTPLYTKGSTEPNGLIPARAGNTRGSTTSAGNPWAHPRSRGEHEVWTCCNLERLGSSPLARGTPVIAFGDSSLFGLIPARAGNTPQVHERQLCLRAHPRSRGEHCWGREGLAGLWGSSPLARGTHPDQQPAEGSGGLIPARAGNTPLSTIGGGGSGAHPRSRGEHCCPEISGVQL